jgi:hypothetical protein
MAIITATLAQKSQPGSFCTHGWLPKFMPKTPVRKNWQENGRDDGQPLHHLVHAVGGHREVGVQRGGHLIAVGIHHLEDANEVVMHVPVIDEVVRLHDAVRFARQTAKRFQLRINHLAQLHDITLHRKNRIQHGGRRVGDDRVLQAVNRLVEGIQGGEIAIDECIEQDVEQVIRAARHHAREALFEPRALVIRGEPTPVRRDEEGAADKEIHLVRRDRVIGELHVEGDEVIVTVELLQFRALPLPGEVLGRQPDNAEIALQPGEIILRRAVEVHPDARVRVGHQRLHLLLRGIGEDRSSIGARVYPCAHHLPLPPL